MSKQVPDITKGSDHPRIWVHSNKFYNFISGGHFQNKLPTGEHFRLSKLFLKNCCVVLVFLMYIKGTIKSDL